MDVKLTPEHKQLIDAVRSVLKPGQVGGPAGAPNEPDLASFSSLEAAGFLDVIASNATAVEAVLVVEEAAASAPGAPVAGRALVAPMVLDRPLNGVVALAERRSGSVVRFAEQAGSFLALADGEAWLADAGSARLVPAWTRWGYPTARVDLTSGEPCGPGSGQRLLSAWRIALAAEAGGMMEAVTLRVTRYARERYAFGKPIGSLQSIQHRLARAYALSQAVKWLARRAAWDPGDVAAAASAASYAALAMREVITSAHQVCGGMGITDEFGVSSYTAKLAMLHLELGGARAHARAVGHARWDRSGHRSEASGRTLAGSPR
jgi:Acyl-CoA dehydrogenase, C-terminal domain